MVGQEALDRAAQQRRVMSRHRRHDEKARLRPARRVLEGALEMQEPTERPLPYRRNVHRHMLAADHGGGDIPLRLAVAPRRALEQLQARGHGLAEGGVGQRIGGIAIEQARSIGERARGVERGLTHFIEPVGRRRIHRAAGAECGRRTAELTNRHFPGLGQILLHCNILSWFCHTVNITHFACRYPVYPAEISIGGACGFRAAAKLP